MSDKPIKKYSSGNVQVSIWANEGKDQSGKPKTNYSFTFQKCYKKKDSTEWENSNSFFDKELLELKNLVEFLCQKRVRVIKTKDGAGEVTVEDTDVPVMDDTEDFPF
jgi:hypothetical protein